MKETFFFPHDYNARNDRKLVKLAYRHGMAGIGVYWCIVEKLYEEAGFLPLDLESIAYELRTDVELVKSVIHDFELFQFDDEKFWSETAIERLKVRMEKSEKARNSVLSRWSKYERNTDVLQPNNGRNTRKGKESTVKNRKEKELSAEVDFEKIVEDYHTLCPDLPRITKLTDLRKSHLRARIKDQGPEKLNDVFRIAGASDFLSGRKNGNWKANLDWILNPTNFFKILEGNYNNANESRDETPKRHESEFSPADFQ